MNYTSLLSCLCLLLMLYHSYLYIGWGNSGLTSFLSLYGGDSTLKFDSPLIFWEEKLCSVFQIQFHVIESWSHIPLLKTWKAITSQHGNCSLLVVHYCKLIMQKFLILRVKCSPFWNHLSTILLFLRNLSNERGRIRRISQEFILQKW